MRSKLFVPGARPELFSKAEASAADALSFDLEDAVAEARKDEAREAVVGYLRARRSSKFASGKKMIVRINAADSPHYEKDIAALLPARPDIINLPMAEEVGAVRDLAEVITRYGHETRILVNIESPLGLRRATDLARAHPLVAGLQIGYADLLEPCGMDRRDDAVVSYIRITVRLAAAEAGIAAYDGAFADIKDVEGFRKECMDARRQGYAGKSCIHPSQIAIVNNCFMPTADELAWARKILEAEAAAQGQGAFLVDGKMVDKPFLDRARALVAMAPG
jgi:citrate lyase subunit beta/citryl-CoA lyase